MAFAWVALALVKNPLQQWWGSWRLHVLSSIVAGPHDIPREKMLENAAETLEIHSEVLKLSDLSVLSDIETSGPTLILVLLVQMSERGLESLECL